MSWYERKAVLRERIERQKEREREGRLSFGAAKKASRREYRELKREYLGGTRRAKVARRVSGGLGWLGGELKREVRSVRSKNSVRSKKGGSRGRSLFGHGGVI